jgi:hypothetical protein
VKRGYISPVHHSNVSMLKTMELLLGLPPRSQFDRYATDMRDYFTTTPDLAPFVALPRRVAPATNPAPKEAANPYLRRAAEMSESLNLELYDSAGENLSQVLWLVHVGERLERERRLAVAAVVLMVMLLVGAGALYGRRAARVVAE